MQMIYDKNAAGVSVERAKQMISPSRLLENLLKIVQHNPNRDNM